MKAVGDFLDPGYYILAHKRCPLSEEEQAFSEIYANSICLHSLNLVLTVPAGVYYFHYFRASRANPIDDKRLRWAQRRMLVFLPLCFATMATAYWYEKTSDFGPRLREIEQFYLSHKGEDLDQISFSPQVLQTE
jgi:hypothetical protein